MTIRGRKNEPATYQGRCLRKDRFKKVNVTVENRCGPPISAATAILTASTACCCDIQPERCPSQAARSGKGTRMALPISSTRSQRRLQIHPGSRENRKEDGAATVSTRP